MTQVITMRHRGLASTGTGSLPDGRPGPGEIRILILLPLAAPIALIWREGEPGCAEGEVAMSQSALRISSISGSQKAVRL